LTEVKIASSFVFAHLFLLEDSAISSMDDLDV